MLGSRLSDPRGFSCHETQNSLEAPVSHLVLEFAEVSGRGNGRRWGPPWPQRPGSTAAPVRVAGRAGSQGPVGFPVPVPWRPAGVLSFWNRSASESGPSGRDAECPGLCASRFEAEESEPLYC